MTKTALILLPLLASCSALDIDEARIGASSFLITATDEGTVGGQAVRSTADGTGEGATLELTNHVSKDTSAGLLFGYSTGSIVSVDIEQIDVAAVGRHYLIGDTLRPYLEGRAGWMRFGASDEFMESDGLDAFKVGASLGLELHATSSVVIFLQGNYDAAFAPDFTTQGASVTIGGALRF